MEGCWEKFQEKAKTCKRALLAWNKVTFKNVVVEISKLKILLQKLLNGGNSVANWEENIMIRKEIDGLWKQEEMYWGQKSRLKWLTYGDKNSKFFHATTVQRRNRNKLFRIKNKDGEWVEGQANVMYAIEKYFKEIYVPAPTTDYQNCRNVIPSKVLGKLNKVLMAAVSCAEVERVVFALGGSQSSRARWFKW